MPVHNDVKTFARDHGIDDVDALTVYAHHYGSDHDALKQFEDRYMADLDGDDRDDATKEWYFDEYLGDVYEKSLDKLLELARDLNIQVDYRDVDGIALNQEFDNHSGYIFRTH